MSLLSITGLEKTYKNRVRALDGINLDIPNGIFGLLGPNGAGKSTLMRTIATLQAPDAGRLTFDEIDVLAEPQKLRAQLGYLPQDFGVYPRMSARALLDHLAVLKGIATPKVRRQLVDTLLEQTNLTVAANKPVAGYSGGMRQRFGIAQALIGDPKLVIVDEPTAGLDPEERYRFQNLLSEIGENVVVILSTHIVEDVSELCPQMAIMAGGRILKGGNPATLTAELSGKVWRTAIDRALLADYRAKHQVISARLVMGQTVIQVLSDVQPGPEFDPADATLEDVYFATVRSASGRAASQAE